MALPELNDEPYVRKKASDFNAQATLADMHAHSNDYQAQALDEFQAVLKGDPANELANRGLGYWFLRNGRYDEASQAFQRALAASEDDAQLHYLVAYLINRKSLKTGASPRDVLTMKTELETAIQLDPSFADAHNLLAFALASQQRYDLAIVAEKKAIELNPSDESFQANLAHIYAQAAMWSDAEAVLTRLELSNDPKVHDEATQSLAALKAQREQATEKQHARAMGVSDPTAPQWKMTPQVQSEDAQTDAGQTEQFDRRKTQYLSGELEAVDCSHSPVAVLTVRKGPKLMKLRTDDYNKLIVMGADSFSCDWRNRKILVNYKPGGKSDGDLVTLEIEAAGR
jgi:Flp pilus assembly protein TadD